MRLPESCIHAGDLPVSHSLISGSSYKTPVIPGGMARALKGYDMALHLGTPAEKLEEYRRASPINYVERLAAPLLIIQGKNDVRDPPRQVELYEAKAKSLGKDVTVVWFDTGHAGSGVDVDLTIRHHETMLRWMYDVLAKKHSH